MITEVLGDLLYKNMVEFADNNLKPVTRSHKLTADTFGLCGTKR